MKLAFDIMLGIIGAGVVLTVAPYIVFGIILLIASIIDMFRR